MIKIAKFLFIVLLPVFLLLGSVRFLTSQQYLALEYGKTNFPADPYGLTKSQRLTIASDNLRYVRENLSIEALSSQVLEGHSVYNSRELSHMIDVQNVFQSLWRVWQLTALLVLVTGFLLWKFADRTDLLSAIRIGGFLTSGIILGLGLLAIVAWQGWFTIFHQLFFQPGTWLFEYTDILIRLFPEKFWFDSALTLLGLSFIEGLLLAGFAWGWRRSLGPQPFKPIENNLIEERI